MPKGNPGGYLPKGGKKKGGKAPPPPPKKPMKPQKKGKR